MNYRVRRWKKTDQEILKKRLNNIHIWEKLCDNLPLPFTDEDAVSFLDKATANSQDFDAYALEIGGSKESSEVCGGVYLKRAEAPHSMIYLLNFWMCPDYADSNALSEVLKDLMPHYFFHLPVMKIMCKVHSDDTDYEEILKKVGFCKEASLSNAVLKSGKILDLHIYTFSEHIKD